MIAPPPPAPVAEEEPIVGPADPDCFCTMFHLAPDQLRGGDWGHCACRCHGPGRHLSPREGPCPCNTERVG